MKKVILFVLLVVLLCAACSTKKSNEYQHSDNFGFTLTYGTYGKQKVDTFEDVVVKDLVEDGIIEAKIALSEEEMKNIRKKMLDLDLMNDLQITAKECEVEPISVSKWYIEMDAESKKIEYNSCNKGKEITEIKNLEEYVHNLVIEKDQYKTLPEANGFYE
ncbi:hypothetical protein FZC84_15385 [Rossellomorea vietnamensis]|uniref:Lipoprotein n=1 Tax=Rossellomorea vietnamensis TaxID=218284 RepID=A0A5D4M9Q6_9BACI|nr:hypothetical protein [Rossellomorea vietnamensis]TYR98291.1 hypothetical protein FZC84_15385 [Rossellomorea vietnamensis]